MIIVHVFLSLCWATLVLGTLVGGWNLSWRYAVDSDAAEVAFLPAALGTLVRVLATLALLAVEIGLPRSF